MIAGALDTATTSLNDEELTPNEIDLLGLMNPSLDRKHHPRFTEKKLKHLVDSKLVTTSGNIVEWRQPYLQKVFRLKYEEILKKARNEEILKKACEEEARKKRWWRLW